MSDFMREEFESAMSLETGLSIELFELDRNGDSYLSTGPKYAWRAWKASRECLVIELPKPRVARGYGEQVADALGFNDGINYCEEAIHAAGVKTK